MTDLSALLRPDSPRVHLWPTTAAELQDELSAWELAGPGKRVARVIRGKKCGTAAAFFDEAAAALQFPLYFGGNWDAFADCFRDLARFGEKSAVVVAITDANKLPADVLEMLGEVLLVCLDDVNQPEKPMKPRPLHVILEGKTATIAKKWRTSGLEVGE
jgi:hypothetical protein